MAASSGDYLDFYLAELRAFRSGEPQSRELKVGEDAPALRASALGKCLNCQHRLRLGEVVEREFDAKTLRTFHHGDVIGREIVRMYRRLGLTRHGPDISGGETRLHDDDLNLSGHVDLILGWQPESVDTIPAELRDEWSLEWVEFLAELRGKVVDRFKLQPGHISVVELKTTHSTALKYLYKDDAPRYNNAVQAGAYRLMATRHPDQLPEHETVDYRVEYVGKDSFGMLSFDIGPEWALTAEKAAVSLNQFMMQGVPSDDVPCTCEGWEVEYCDFGLMTKHDEKSVTFSCCGGKGFYTRKKKAADVL